MGPAEQGLYDIFKCISGAIWWCIKAVLIVIGVILGVSIINRNNRL